jgi:phosphoenolpyruvate carboxylase
MAAVAWARRRFVRAGIRLEPEVSFQGGDGYLFFGTDDLALATLTRFIELAPAEADPYAPTDPFYRRTDLSLDFYRAIRRVQQQHLTSSTYARAVTAFGLGLLNDTGSRKSRRQSDVSADRSMSLRQIRAIPHNAILQQLGYPVNIIAGFGTAAEGNYEAMADLLASSDRGRQMVRLVRSANAVASIKTATAFGELFNSAYWASRPYRGDENHIAQGCLALAEYLTSDDRTACSAVWPPACASIAETAPPAQPDPRGAGRPLPSGPRAYAPLDRRASSAAPRAVPAYVPESGDGPRLQPRQ